MKTFARRLLPIVLLAALMWAIAGVDWFLHLELVDFGVRPRTFDGLAGVLFAPFIHVNLTHLVSNTVPLLALGALVLLSGPVARFWIATAIIMIAGYFLIWVFGRGPDFIHIGASGLVFGYFGLLVARGLIERSTASVVWALLAVLLYGGLFWVLLSVDPMISFEGHIFGFLAGVLAAWLTVPRRRRSIGSAPP